MIQPIWTFGEHGVGYIPQTGILLQAYNPEFEYLSRWTLVADFLDIMQGQIQIEGIATNVNSEQNGFYIGLYNKFLSEVASTPLQEFFLPMHDFLSSKASIDLASGIYVVLVVNVDPDNDVLLKASFNKLSWPGYG